MKRLIFLLTISFLMAFQSSAITLTGKVFDKTNENPVEGALIEMILAGKKVSKTTSASNGTFSINVKKNMAYEMLVTKTGFEEKRIPVETKADNDKGLPSFHIYLDDAKLKLKGIVKDRSSGLGIPTAKIQFENQISGKVADVYADENGMYSINLQPNETYKLQYIHVRTGVSSPAIFVSTMGVQNAVTITRDIEVGIRVSNSDELINSKSGSGLDIGLGQSTSIKSAPGSTFYVVDKPLEKIDWTKKLQRKRTDNMPTIYFYAEKPDEKEVLEVTKELVITKEPEEVKVERVIVEEQIVKLEEEVLEDKEVVAKVEKEVKKETKKKVKEEKVKVKKVKEEKVKTFTPKVKKTQTQDLQIGGLETLEEELEEEKLIIDPSISIDEPEKSFAEQMKSQLETPKDIKPEVAASNTKSAFNPKRNTVYFNKGKAKITDAYKTVLNKMAEKLLANGKMRITLVAHTDNDVEYSIENYLSKLRAESVLDYLLNKGIAFERMEIRIAGNKFPANGCVYGVDCSEEEHMMNRRVELKTNQNVPY